MHVTDVDEAVAREVADEINASADGPDADGGRAGREPAGNGATGRAHGSALDVRDPQACRDVARAAEAGTGSLDLWVNNAGVLITAPSWEHTDDQRRLMFEVNALGTMHGTIAALEVMRPVRRGHIVNIASLAGLVSVPGEAIYAATKHAVMGFSTSTLADLRAAGEQDIHISCVCPDGMWTPMLYDKLNDPTASMSFSGKLLQPSEVAEVVLKVVARPRPVVTAPRWRGVQARAFDLTPGLAMRAVPLLVRASRVQQRSVGRRVRRGGGLPPQP